MSIVDCRQSISRHLTGERNKKSRGGRRRERPLPKSGGSPKGKVNEVDEMDDDNLGACLVLPVTRPW